MYVIANVSPQDLILLFVIALLVFGPKRLPEVGRQVGHAMRDLKKLSGEFTGALMGVQDEVHSAVAPIMAGTFDRIPKAMDQMTSSEPSRAVPTVETADPMAVKTEFGESPPPRQRLGVTLSTLPPEDKGEA